MEDWETADIDIKLQQVLRTNKWEGEDEEEDVKDSWEDEEDDEKKDVEKVPEVSKAKPKPKKKIHEKIEERERKDREEAEKRAREKEEAMTPEERTAEKLRRQKMAEEADLRLAMETFGVVAIDAMLPDTKEDFEQFGEALYSKINSFSKHSEYPLFAEELINRIAITLPAASLKKLKTSIDNLSIAKTKIEQGSKSKKNKGKGKASLKMDGDSSHINDPYDAYTYDNDYDEFM